MHGKLGVLVKIVVMYRHVGLEASALLHQVSDGRIHLRPGQTKKRNGTRFDWLID